ncbi:PREDICTED: interferon lambda-1 [Condylura cristata]|uniref:interferon lambda-1 n=1 Tax=Condylura cristata TaxID=143302 RepID=UPI0003346707|nr:PREDICTED: interferon lambda-1 [Condylura cristata]
MAAVRLLVLVALGLASTRAGPVPTSKPITTKRSCDIGRFKSLSPRELAAFKVAKDALEEWLLPKDRSCSSRLFPRTRDLRQLQLSAQPAARPRPRGRLRHWLHRLREAQKKESPECLQASVTFHLFHLVQDLNCVASGDQCA